MESSQANVQSIDALKRFRAALVVFQEAASLALEEVGSELQQSLLWLREDRMKYWKKRVHECRDVYTQARLALKQREVFDRTLSGSRSSCVDERRALKKAEQRLQEAEYRYQRVKMYIEAVDKATSDYKGMVKRLGTDVEVDLPNAWAALDKMIDSLERYVALAPPELSAGPARTVEREVGLMEESELEEGEQA